MAAEYIILIIFLCVYVPIMAHQILKKRAEKRARKETGDDQPLGSGKQLPPADATPSQPPAERIETLTAGDNVILTVPRDLKMIHRAHEMLSVLEREIKGEHPKVPPKKKKKKKKAKSKRDS